MTIIKEAADVEQVLAVLDSALALLKWRLKPYARRRLQTDVLALCTGLRPVVMVDYGGRMPELQRHLCSVLGHAQKVALSCNFYDLESAIFLHLRVMIIEDMIYLVNIDEFQEYIRWSLNSGANQVFVDLERDPVKMITDAAENSVAMKLLLIQELFSSVFSGSGVNHNAMQCQRSDCLEKGQAYSMHATSHFSEVIDLSSCLEDSQVTIPTLNGWLLSYPVVYLISKDHVPDAVYNLSTKSLNIFKVLACRNVPSNGQSQPEELMSFSVPYELSMEGRSEAWSKAFWARMQAKWERCKNAWKPLRLDVSACSPQAVAL